VICAAIPDKVAQFCDSADTLDFHATSHPKFDGASKNPQNDLTNLTRERNCSVPGSARERTENQRTGLLDALAEREQNAAADRSSLSEILIRREALQAASKVLHDRKYGLEEEITQGHRWLADGQMQLLHLAMNLCRDESLTETAGW
jgi:hypothetical protein